MANNYYDATGVLILDRVTPVITALFRDFNLDEKYPGNGRAYIARISEDNSPSWDCVLDGLIALAAELDLPAPGMGEDDGSDDEPVIHVVLDLLASHFGAGQNDDLAHLIEHHRFEDDADLDSLFLIATCFNDGHNLVAIQFEERDLEAQFGAQYREYRERVPMLIPFTRRTYDRGRVTVRARP